MNDVGHNLDGLDPSPLQMNTFSLGRDQAPFPNLKTVLVAPDLMTYPGMHTVYANKPMQVGDGSSMAS